MTNGLYTTAVGMIPLMNKQDIISNNLANLNTTGYKKDAMSFKKILDAQLYQQLYQGDGEFLAEVEDIYTDYSQGSLAATGNPLDMAIVGNGFFVLETPQGKAYTRNGNFMIDNDQQLVSNCGYPLLGEGGIIDLSKTDIMHISETGEVFINNVRVNKIILKDFEQSQSLKKIGNGLFVPRSETVQEVSIEKIDIKQGYLEQSNVNPVSEMVEMMLTLRQFESIQKILRFQNEILGKSVNELGRYR